MAVNIPFLLMLVISIVLLFVSMVFSILAAENAYKNPQQAHTYATRAALVSGLAVLVLLITMFIYLFRGKIFGMITTQTPVSAGDKCSLQPGVTDLISEAKKGNMGAVKYLVEQKGVAIPQEAIIIAAKKRHSDVASYLAGAKGVKVSASPTPSRDSDYYDMGDSDGGLGGIFAKYKKN